MTRKCVLCKETNYRNTYSFFSAPKDPETRKKWQNAIAIENYSVTDDTYVCSKHFHKNDIITHWVSGVPPHVITIKYKKCRLRPGAVPNRNYHLENNAQKSNQKHTDEESNINMSEYITFKATETQPLRVRKESFLIPRSEEKTNRNHDKNHRNITSNYPFSRQFPEYDYALTKKTVSIKVEPSEDSTNVNVPSLAESKANIPLEQNLKESNKVLYSMENSICNTDIIDTIKCENIRDEENRIHDTNCYSDTVRTISKSSSKVFNTSECEDTSTEMWEKKVTRKNPRVEDKPVDNAFKTMEDLHIENQVLNSLSYDHLDTYYHAYNDVAENEMLFEDLLEVCTEVMLPRGWSCLVTSKGHTTTIVYLYMGMTKNGMPFSEKQVFVKSDMMLHCSAVNKEINPLMHNLIREGKHTKVQSLLDVEELIDEFDQRIVCQGVYNAEGYQKMNGFKIAYKDGIKWRHVRCPLIVNNDSTRCTKCITLSRVLARKSKNFLPFHYNPLIIAKKQQNVHLLHQIRKRTRKHDRRHGFIKELKNE